jgi:hypothetical protein
MKWACQGCTKRSVGCHATCEAYQKQKAAADKAREAKRKAKETDRYFIEKHMDHMDRFIMGMPTTDQRKDKQQDKRGGRIDDTAFIFPGKG